MDRKINGESRVYRMNLSEDAKFFTKIEWVSE